MTVRTSMTAIITQLRLITDDPAGTGAQFTDQQHQDVLDQYAAFAVCEQLNPIENITTAGLTEYKRYVSNHQYWETDAGLTTGNFVALTPATSNFMQGVWTFTVSTIPPVLITGTWFDLYGAAADVWTLKASSYARQTDFSADGSSYSLSQRYQNALRQAEACKHKSIAANGMTTLTRTDVIC